MKKNIAMRVAALILMCTIVSSCFVGSTFAKYTSSVTGTSTATVAKWSIKVNNNEIAVSPAPALAFNLFDTIKEADTTSAETNVAAGKIAPGTGGQFALSVQNMSEVDANITITLEETANASNIPIEYSTDKSVWKKAADFSLTGKDYAVSSAKDTVTVYWRWAFTGAASANYTASQTDATDTALGIAAQTSAPTITVTATITATQID